MGIYPVRTKSSERAMSAADAMEYTALVTVWTETVSEPGIKRTRKVFAADWVEERTDCYCCTCDANDQISGSLSDAACRNHGFAGRRPCDIHNLPGEPWDITMFEDDPRAGTMPMAVNEYRKAVADGAPTH